MDALERKRKIVELERVKLGRLELELRIEERQKDIARLEENLVIQDAKIAELQAIVDELE